MNFIIEPHVLDLKRADIYGGSDSRVPYLSNSDSRVPYLSNSSIKCLALSAHCGT
jgi:hypothetical protein